MSLANFDEHSVRSYYTEPDLRLRISQQNEMSARINNFNTNPWQKYRNDEGRVIWHDVRRGTITYRDPNDEADDNIAGKCKIVIPVLPCWDESDDGVPPMCRGEPPVAFWKFFNAKNNWTNDNIVMLAFGNVGFKYFDVHRKSYMAFAMWSTFISIFFTIVGCFGLSQDRRTVNITHWTWVKAVNLTSGSKHKVVMGLRGLVHYHDPCNPFHCTWEGYDFDETDFLDHGILNHLESCVDTTISLQFGVFTSCVTLVFALIGTMNRMRFSSDAPIQKALGMVTDTIGFFTQLLALMDYGNMCFSKDRGISRKYQDKGGHTIASEVWLGPGYYCYVVCLFGAFMRFVMHWLTPTPGNGSGCVPKLPSYIVKQLDIDGDGEISWDEMRQAYAIFIKKRNRESIRRMQEMAGRSNERVNNDKGVHSKQLLPDIRT